MDIPKPKFITKHAGKVMKDGKWVLEEVLKLTMERDMRCGDGTGSKITSHSVNCRCEEIKRELKKFS